LLFLQQGNRIFIEETFSTDVILDDSSLVMLWLSEKSKIITLLLQSKLIIDPENKGLIEKNIYDILYENIQEKSNMIRLGGYFILNALPENKLFLLCIDKQIQSNNNIKLSYFFTTIRLLSNTENI